MNRFTPAFFASYPTQIALVKFASLNANNIAIHGGGLLGLTISQTTSASTPVIKATGTATVLQTQSILGVYWLLFEAFDLLRTAKRKAAAGCAFAFSISKSGPA